jgi:type I restriction enzyme S subunit
LSRDSVGDLEIILPPEEVRSSFDEIVVPLRDRAANCLEEAKVLGALRDALLPKLISGELRIIDAEKQIVAA